MTDKIDNWEIHKLYSSARKNGSWIECISLGYTIFEMQLLYLVRSKARKSRTPLNDDEIEYRYLIELAKLAKNKGFLPDKLFDEIKAFNDTRRKAIHKLLEGNVKKSELKEASEKVWFFFERIQRLWLPIKIGPEKKA